MLRGLHTHVEFVVAADKMRVATWHLWVVRTFTYRCDQVLGGKLHPLELMTDRELDEIENVATALNELL